MKDWAEVAINSMCGLVFYWVALISIIRLFDDLLVNAIIPWFRNKY